MGAEAKLPFIPDKPGVYLFRNAEQKIIYVGKAISLKRRTRSYFQNSSGQSAKVQALRQQAADLEYIVTDNEIEALILESNLIKEHRPQYNIVLKDDKSYPYLKITLNEKFPRLFLTHRLAKDGAKYYGPYTKIGAVQETLALLQKLFPLRSCKKRELEPRSRPCLNYHIKRCLAPCCGLISPEAYGEMVQEAGYFLEGKQEKLLSQLKNKMEAASESLEFEKAAWYRDQWQALQTVLAKQKIIEQDESYRDLVALSRQAATACLMVFWVRSGKLLGRKHFILDQVGEETEAEIITAFLKQYYSEADFIPGEILVPAELGSEGAVIAQWLTEQKGGKVVVKQPQRGDKRKLLEMAVKNSRLVLAEVLTQRQLKTTAAEDLALLAAVLDLPKPPLRMECFDISNTQGTESVASMAVYENGKPAPDQYRKFKIKTVQGADDFASLAEAVGRRFQRGLEEQALINNGQFSSKKAKFARWPDLVLIDGGKGQLAAAAQALAELDLPPFKLMSLAKEEELLFSLGQSEPLNLGLDNPALQMLQRLRDEAHRFAITFHRQLRSKRNLKSLLSEVEGIGAVRQRELLKAFPSLTALGKASLEEVAAVKGMNKKAAQAVLDFLGEKK